jgi:hypothetical protein
MALGRENLVRTVAERLGVPGDGQAPFAEDADKIRDALDGVAEDLVGRGVVDYIDLDDIERPAYLHLADVIAARLAPQFGMPQDLGAVMLAETRLRSLGAMPVSYEPALIDFY